MSDAGALKILLVDDDNGHADLMKMNLERSGVANDILHFTTGQKALDFLLTDSAQHQGKKYLMTLDINMPGLDGHQVLERIKGNEQTKHIPVIVLTTAEDQQEVEQCYALGCNLYMTKPMTYESFCTAMHELGIFIQQARIPGVSMLVA